MKVHFITLLIIISFLNSYSQCSSLQPIQLPFFEGFESYSDTLSGIDTLNCNSNFRWTFESSTALGRALCGTGSPVSYIGNGAITFDVNSFGTFNTNELTLTLNLSNYTLLDPVFLSFDCNNIADEPNLEDRIYMRGSDNESWIEVYDWSVLPNNVWVSEEETINVSSILSNNSQSFSSSFQVKFSQRDNYGYSSDGFAIDNVKLSVVTCPKPNNLILNSQTEDSIVFSWTSLGSETSWEVQYGAKDFILGQGNLITSHVTSDTLTNLSSGEIYDIYVRSNCAINDESSWLGPLTVYMEVTNDSSCNPVFILANGTQHQTHNKNTSTQFGASFYLGNTPYNTVWFKTEVPPSGHLAIESCNSELNTEIGVYETPIDCSDLSTFSLINAASFSSASTNNVCGGPGKSAVELCGLTPGDEIYFWIGSYLSSQEGVINFSVFDYSLSEQAGSSNYDSIKICIVDTINLFDNIENYSTSLIGEWNYDFNQNAILNDSLLPVGSMSYNYNTVDYILSNICNADTVSYSIEVINSNYSGDPITGFESCNTNSIYLFEGLSGLVETTGSWYNNLGELSLAHLVPQELEEGIYQFSYIVNDNICPADTTLVLLNVFDCSKIDEVKNEIFTLYPNPNNGRFNIVSSLNKYSISIFDTKGSMVYFKQNLLSNEIYNVDISIELEGVFILEIVSEKHLFIKKLMKF